VGVWHACEWTRRLPEPDTYSSSTRTTATFRLARTHNSFSHASYWLHHDAPVEHEHACAWLLLSISISSASQQHHANSERKIGRSSASKQQQETNFVFKLADQGQTLSDPFSRPLPSDLDFREQVDFKRFSIVFDSFYVLL